MRYIYYLIWLVIAIIGLTFGLLNARYVRLDYYFHTSEMLLPILLVITLAIGVVLGWLSVSPMLWRVRFSNSMLKRRLKKLEKSFSGTKTDIDLKT